MGWPVTRGATVGNGRRFPFSRVRPRNYVTAGSFAAGDSPIEVFTAEGPGPRGASSRIARTMSGTHVPPHVLPAVDAGDPPSNGSPASLVPRRPSNSSPRGEPVCSPAHVPTPVVVQRARDSEHSRSVSRRARASQHVWYLRARQAQLTVEIAAKAASQADARSSR